MIIHRTPLYRVGWRGHVKLILKYAC